MIFGPDQNFRRFHAGSFFGWLAVFFVFSFGGMVLLVGLDQQRVLEATTRLQDLTVSEIIRHQRLARNLEQLRQEGERVFAASTPQARQRAMFVVALVASHPSVLEHPKSAELARQTEVFLSNALAQSSDGGSLLGTHYEEWGRIASRLSVLVDDVSIQGVNLVNDDLNEVAATMRLARYKLAGALGLVGLFLFFFLVLLRQHLIRPLQVIDRALSTLSVDLPPPVFISSAMSEIQAVEDAIGELHASLLENETARGSLELLANQDGLTGLYNRRHFMALAEAEVQRAKRYLRPVVVGMADLDFFKKLNDTYGHAAGDAVLRALAGLMRESFRQSDLVCRYGGEEFAFVFPESSLAEAHVLAERFRRRCASFAINLPDGREVTVTTSIGLADVGESTLEVALSLADAALYDAKRLGRNQVVLATSETGSGSTA